MAKPAAKAKKSAARATAARVSATTLVATMEVVGVLAVHLDPLKLTKALDNALRASVRGVLPGRQQQKNLEPVMADARKAFLRTLRRRARSLPTPVPAPALPDAGA